MKDTSVSKVSKNSIHFQNMERNGQDDPMDDSTDPQVGPQDVLTQVDPAVQQTPSRSGSQTRLAFPPQDHEIYSQEILEVTGNPCRYLHIFSLKESLGLQLT